MFSVVDRQSGALLEVTDPQSTITHEFFTGLELADAPEEVDMPMTVAGEELKDNRNLKDNNTAQKMKHEDVEFLKEQNTDG